MSEIQLFAFEQDFVATLRCVPMAVRLKLDVSGIKLSLRQWSRFTREDRQNLLLAPCRAASEISAYRAALVELVARRSGEAAKPLAEPPCCAWEYEDRVPERVAAFAVKLGLSCPTGGQWARLTRLQRFALIKLTRDSHDNVNFTPAMREFGLLAEGAKGLAGPCRSRRPLADAAQRAPQTSGVRARVTPPGG